MPYGDGCTTLDGKDMTDTDQTLRASTLLRTHLGSHAHVLPIDRLPGPAYNFSSAEGWLLFESIPAELHVGGTRCYAVHGVTGEIRDLGWIGE